MCLQSSISCFPQEEQNRGKPNWEHLNEDLHVLISVEDSENRAKMKIQRALEEIRKLLVPSVSPVASASPSHQHMLPSLIYFTCHILYRSVYAWICCCYIDHTLK